MNKKDKEGIASRMGEEEYLKQRLDEEIIWYDNKSIKCKNLFRLLKGVEILFATSIPVIASVYPNTVLISIIGGMIALIEGWLSISKYHDNWIEYRSVCELLKQEKYMYITGSGIYRSKKDFQFFVERVESIISKENVNWANLNSEKGD